MATLTTPAIFVPTAGTDFNNALFNASNSPIVGQASGVGGFWIFNTPYTLNIQQVSHAVTSTGTNHLWIALYTADALFGKKFVKSTGSTIIPASGITSIPFVVTLQPGTYFLFVYSDDTSNHTSTKTLQMGIVADYWDDYTVLGHGNPGVGTFTITWGGDFPSYIPFGNLSAADNYVPFVVFAI